MEDSLYGFRFKSQTSLLVSDQHEIDGVEVEPMQWQEPRQQEARTLHPPHHYCDEATQTPNWEHEEQRFDSPSALAPQTRESDGRQSDLTAWNNGGAADFPSGDDPDNWGPQLMWYEAGHPGHCLNAPTPQPIVTNQEVSDESMQMFPQTDPFDAHDDSYDDIKNSIAYQNIGREFDSDASSITMEDACVDGEDAEWEMAVDAEDENRIDAGEERGFAFEGEFPFGEPEYIEGVPRQLYWAIKEAEDRGK
ncbi:hypothetical protein V8C44DRAFT_351752 [Trichoderma aethiopicum]